jgi:hypothetical protein
MCKARYCLDCEVPFHERQTCDEYQADAKRRNEDEQKSLATVKQLSRPCPGPGCGINIDKYTGCDHVTCVTMQHILLGPNSVADYRYRPAVRVPALLGVFRSLRWTQRDIHNRKLCTQGHLPPLPDE